jgi:hypothetical protein
MKSIALWPPQARKNLKQVGWTKGLELAKLAQGRSALRLCSVVAHDGIPTRSSGPPRNLPPLNGGFCQSVSGNQRSGLNVTLGLWVTTGVEPIAHQRRLYLGRPKIRR